LRLLLDEDSQSRRLIQLLREQGHDILTVGEAGRAGASDPEVMRLAAATDRILLTRNCADFLDLHRENPEHRGILCVFQEADRIKSMSWPEIARALKNLEEASVQLRSQFMALNAWLY
jgi:predicted nuclease of predicted toxin-antitoxin system